MVNFGEFLKKTKACGHKVLPDRSLLIGQKLVENAKIEQFKWYILGDFQTMRYVDSRQYDYWLQCRISVAYQVTR